MLICLNCYYKTRHAGRLSHHSFSQLWRQGSPTSGWQLTWFWGRIHSWSRGVCPLTESSCDGSLPPSFYAAPSSWPHIILITSQEVTASTQGLGRVTMQETAHASGYLIYDGSYFISRTLKKQYGENWIFTWSTKLCLYLLQCMHMNSSGLKENVQGKW